MTRPRTIQSVDRALAILEALASQPNGLALFQIAEQVQLHSSTAYHLLATLLSRDFVSQDPKTKIYRLGPGLIRMGQLARTQNNIVSVAMEPLNSLAKETGEFANLAILEEHQAVYLAQAQGDPRNVVTLFTQIGARVPLYSTGVGKAILANLPEEFLKEILQEGLLPITPNTITSESKLRRELDRVRELGYAVDHEENGEGVSCVASPIWNGSDEIVGALSVSGPTARMAALNFEALGQRVREKAREISRRMGHDGQAARP